jgi:hypothetical protein
MTRTMIARAPPRIAATMRLPPELTLTTRNRLFIVAGGPIMLVTWLAAAAVLRQASHPLSHRLGLPDRFTVTSAAAVNG